MTGEETRDLITAAYFADLRTIKRILKRENQKKTRSRKGKACAEISYRGYSLREVTQLWSSILAYHTFPQEVVPIIEKMRKRNDDVITYLGKEYGITMQDNIEEMLAQCDCMTFRANEHKTLNDLFYGSIDDFLASGCRMIDLQLYEAIAKVNLPQMKQLLDTGANPDAKLHTKWDADIAESCREKVCARAAILMQENIKALQVRFKRHQSYFVDIDDIQDLEAWAAYEMMRHILDEYTPAKQEYPATHSMSTAWFGVDEDGNVAVLQFNENGPVPCNLPEEGAENMMSHYLVSNNKGLFKNLNYTDEQVQEMMSNSEDVKEIRQFIYHTLVQIDVNKEKEFRDIIRSSERSRYHPCFCLSRKLGVYWLEICEISLEARRKLLKDMIILRMRKFNPSLDPYDEQEDIDIKNFPFYIYRQPYSFEQLMYRASIPKFPMKADQFPELSQVQMLRFPFKFSEKQEMQIAEYFIFNACADSTYIDGVSYQLLPTEDGGEAYFNNATLPYILCGKTCKLCEASMKYYWHSYSNKFATSTPTVLLVSFPDEWTYELWSKQEHIVKNMVEVPLLQGNPYTSILDDYRFTKTDTAQMVINVFSRCRVHLEQNIQLIRPRVILLSSETKDVIRRFYPTTDTSVEVMGEQYPYFLEEKIEENRSEIEALASMPYRGTRVKHKISIEEFEKLKAEGRVSQIE